MGALGGSDGASLLLMARHRQVNSRISKSNQSILMFNFIITTFNCQGDSQGGGISARAFFVPARLGVAPPLMRGLEDIEWEDIGKIGMRRREESDNVR